MNFTQCFTALTVSVLNADGKCDAIELKTIRSIAKDFELDVEEVNACIKKELASPTPISMVSSNITESDAQSILDACVSVALSDNVLKVKEVDLLLSVAKSINVNPSKVVLDIAIFAQNNRNIQIEGNEDAYNADVELTIEDE